jgi:hypothetical protein
VWRCNKSESENQDRVTIARGRRRQKNSVGEVSKHSNVRTNCSRREGYSGASFLAVEDVYKTTTTHAAEAIVNSKQDIKNRNSDSITTTTITMSAPHFKNVTIFGVSHFISSPPLATHTYGVWVNG